MAASTSAIRQRSRNRAPWAALWPRLLGGWGFQRGSPMVRQLDRSTAVTQMWRQHLYGRIATRPPPRRHHASVAQCPTRPRARPKTCRGSGFASAHRDDRDRGKWDAESQQPGPGWVGSRFIQGRCTCTPRGCEEGAVRSACRGVVRVSLGWRSCGAQGTQCGAAPLGACRACGGSACTCPRLCPGLLSCYVIKMDASAIMEPAAEIKPRCVSGVSQLKSHFTLMPPAERVWLIRWPRPTIGPIPRRPPVTQLSFLRPTSIKL